MFRFLVFVAAVAVLSQIEGVHSSCITSAQTGCTPCIRPDPDPNKKVENKSPNVIDVQLDRTELQLPAKPDPQGHSKEFTIGVKTSAVDPEGDIITYNYTISGGRIVGTGKNVTWDLNVVRAGTYTITAGVDDGCGVCGTRITKSITVKDNWDD